MTLIGQTATLDDQTAQAVSILRRAQYLIILTGAGVSQESGIPTFRDAQTGLWARYDPMELATPQAFCRKPELVWEWYTYRRRLVAEAKPNPGHRALVELERHVPRVVVLTQNVDGLHQKAGSSDVVELHGSIWRDKCYSACQGEPTLVNTAALAGSPPGCPHCGAPVRPDIVWFGEPLPPDALGRANQASIECDVMLVVGTSGAVYPAAELPVITARAGHPVIEVNQSTSGITPVADLFLLGPGGSVLPRLLEALDLPPTSGQSLSSPWPRPGIGRATKET